MAKNRARAQKRHRDGRWAKQSRKARASGAGESRLSPPGMVADRARLAVEHVTAFRAETARKEAEEKTKAAAFVEKYYPDLPGLWARNKDEMEFGATAMFASGNVAIAQQMCSAVGQKVREPRVEPPSVLSLEVSRTLASVDQSRRGVMVDRLVSSV